jgi:hypothetical protein
LSAKIRAVALLEPRGGAIATDWRVSGTSAGVEATVRRASELSAWVTQAAARAFLDIVELALLEAFDNAVAADRALSDASARVELTVDAA